MPTAKNREEFIRVWEEQFNYMRYLAHSLPSKEALAYLAEVKALRNWVAKAANNTFPEVAECAYCGAETNRVCPVCLKPTCELCLELPCENDHKEPEPEDWDYLRTSPEEQVAELQLAEQEGRHRNHGSA